MKSVVLGLGLLVTFNFGFAAEIPLQAKAVSFSELVGDKARLKEYILAISTNGSPHITISLPASETSKLKSGCYMIGKLSITKACLEGLSEARADEVIDLVSRSFDLFSPSYTLTFDPKVNSLLNEEPYIQYLHGRVDFHVPTDAKQILPAQVADRLWTSTLEYYQANCLGTSIASVNKNIKLSYLWPPRKFLATYFEEIKETEPLQVGDIFAFIIPDDGHFFTYIGTDEVTQEKMVLTKNGSAPGPFQFSSYKDVAKVYARFTRGTTRYRSLNFVTQRPTLFLSRFVTPLNLPTPNLTNEQSVQSKNLFVEFLNNSQK